MSNTRKSKLLTFRTEIAELRQEGNSYEDIITTLEEQYSIQISLSQLKRVCKDWKISSSSINLEPFRTEIQHLYLELGYSRQQILTILYNRENIQLSLRTLARQINDKWKLQVQKKLPTYLVPILRARITILFFQNVYSDDQIIEQLRTEGIELSKFQLRKIRSDLGLVRRKDEISWEKEEEAMKSVIATELKKGITDSFGRQLLHIHFRSRGYNISRLVFIIIIRMVS